MHDIGDADSHTMVTPRKIHTTEQMPQPASFAVRIDSHEQETRPCRELDWSRCGVTSRQDHQAHYALFSAQGEVEVEVRVPFEWQTVTVRPLRHGIVPERTATGIRFRMATPAKLSIEFDGDLIHALFILANPPELKEPAPDTPGVRFFKAGAEYDTGEIRLGAGETLYLEDGAVVHGWVVMKGAHGARIAGRGILDGSHLDHNGGRRPQMIRVDQSNGVVVEGITLVNGPSWHLVPVACRNTTIRDLNIIGFSGCGDGIDVVSCDGTTITNCFIRANDDCIAVKALANVGGRNVHGVRVSGGVFWNAPWGNALEIGYETCCETISDILFEDCDIIHVEREGWGSGGTFTIHNGDRALVRDVTYRNIRVEDSREKLIDLKVQHSKWSTDSRRGCIEEIRFEDIAIVDGPFPVSIIQGLDSEHLVSHVSIANLTHRGERITNATDAKMIVEMAPDVDFH